jgi:hypothetical protein
MDIFGVRRKATAALESDLKKQALALQFAFDVLEVCLKRLQIAGQSDSFARTVLIVLVKAKQYALGVYALALDGLAQEGGAMLRPWVEAIELLRYLHLDPTRVEQVIKGKLPPVGAIAAKIDGKFKWLRDLLNQNASHLSMSHDALRHIATMDSGEVKLDQSYSEPVLRHNVALTFWFLYFTLVETLICLGVAAVPNEDIAEYLEKMESDGHKVLPLAPGGGE